MTSGSGSVGRWSQSILA